MTVPDLSSLGSAGKRANAIHAMHQIKVAAETIEHYLIYEPPSEEVMKLLRHLAEKIGSVEK